MSDHIMIRRAQAATSWNPETWTFDVVRSTGAPVQRVDARGAYDELLAIEQAAFSRLCPLLDSHNRESVDAVLGHVDNLRAVGGELLGRATLSRHNPRSQRIAAELSDGRTFGVSIGYTVSKWSERTDPATGRCQRVAVAFTVLETSLVAIPADRHAGIRSMTTDTTQAATPDTNQTAAVDRAAATLDAAASRAAVNGEIRAIARTTGLAQDWIDGQIDRGASVDQARAAALEAMQTRTAAAQGLRNQILVGTDHNDPAARVRAMGEALFVRVDPSHKPGEQARQYVGLTVPELARECLRARGESTTGLSSAGIVERSLQTTGDFPMILADTVGRTLRQAYDAAPAGVRQLGRQTTAKDFRAKHRIQLSGAPTLEPVNEHGEFKSGALAEAQESYSVSTFGRIIGFTRQAMVNDDLGAFSDITRRMGVAAAAFEANFLAALLLSNPKMSDGKALFHADHGNLAAAGGAITADTLSAARLAMRKQKGLNDELIAVTPKYLVVGPDRETEAEKALATISPSASADVNPFAGKLEIVVDPRLSAAWFVVADPAQIDGLEYAYLEGAIGPQVTSQVGFDVDGVRFRVRLDFGAGFVDWRGWHKNAGA